MPRTTTAEQISSFALQVIVDYKCHKFRISDGIIYIKFTCNGCRSPHSGEKGIGIPIGRGKIHKASFQCSSCHRPGEAEVSGITELINPRFFGNNEATLQTLLKVSSKTSEPTDFLTTNLRVYTVRGESSVVLHGETAPVGEIDEVGAKIMQAFFVADKAKKKSATKK